MTLHVKSMNKLHKVVKLSASVTDFRNGLVQVATLGRRPVKAKQYAARWPSSIVDSGDDCGFFICSDGLYYAVCLVSDSQEDVNRCLAENADYSVIATDNAGFHYVARNVAAKFDASMLSKTVIK